MPALYPRWTNTATRLVLGALLTGIVGVPTILLLWARAPFVTGELYPLAQPVEFDHRHHVQDDGIDCVYCHETAFRAPSAGMPATEVCMGCHNQIWNQSPLLEPVRASYFGDTPIRWNRVHDLPDFVYFDHSIHVNHGVGCVSCHGRVDQMAAVYQVMPLTMSWCLDCHTAPERFLRPVDRITDLGWRPDRPQAELGAELKRQYGVRELVTCTACHR